MGQLYILLDEMGLEEMAIYKPIILNHIFMLAVTLKVDIDKLYIINSICNYTFTDVATYFIGIT